jgi:hypothetical protein
MRKPFRDAVVMAIALFVATLNADGQTGVPRFNDCGTECVQGAIIDARTGRVFMLPFSLSCWGTDVGVNDRFKPVEFRLNSGLIVPSGARNEKEGDYATRHYGFQDNRLPIIKSVQH